MECTNAEKCWNVSLGPKEQCVTDNTQRQHYGRNTTVLPMKLTVAAAG